ncbi:MAG: tetratricopeptide repeat protein [Phycisphaerales bacterium]|nr:tetratricopeptide repeat protein [Phycisphaerales bacterium]
MKYPPHRLMLVSVLGVLVALSSCNGITASGRQARVEANERFDRMNARFMVDQGKQSLASGQYTTALQMGNKLVEMFPKDREFRTLRGRTLLAMNRLESALADFNACAEATKADEKSESKVSKPNDAESAACSLCAYFAGTVYERLGDYEKARESFAAALEGDPSTLQFATAHAESLLALGRMQEARDLVAAMSNRFSYSSAVQHLRAEIAAMSDEHSGAAERLQRVVALVPHEAGIQEELLHAEFRQGRWGVCLEMLEHEPFIEVANRPDLVRLRARCLLMSNDGVAARDLLLAFPETSGHDSEQYWIILGLVAWHIGDETRLAQAASMLIGLDPSSAEGHLFQGQAAQRGGNQSRAVESFSMARQFSSEEGLAARLLPKNFIP